MMNIWTFVLTVTKTTLTPTFYNRHRKKMWIHTAPLQHFGCLFKWTTREESLRFYIVKHPMWKEGLCTQRSWPLRTKNKCETESSSLSTVNQSIGNFSFRPSCNKNRSCQRPDQQHSAQSRSCRCCSCRIGSCPLGWDTCHWPFRHRTRCPCRRCRSPHQRSCRHWSLLQSCSGSCSLRR